MDVLAAALAGRITLIDSARVYTSADCRTSSERLVGRALARLGAGGQIAVATKGGHVRDCGRFVIDGRPEAIRRHLEESLLALGADRIGLYLLHKPDPAVPIADSVGAIVDLQREGKVGDVGVSNVTAEQFAEAISVAEIAAVQNHTTLLAPDPLIEICAHAGIRYLAYAPFQGSADAIDVKRSATMAAAAHRRGCSREQLILALLVASSSNLWPVVGARRPSTITASTTAETHTPSPAEARTILADLRRELENRR
jgi:aryl-alcohol dehydrogenase-like predicted oxidoreductase